MKVNEYPVIKRKYLPTALPVFRTVILLAILDIYNAPGWLWGAAITFFVILWSIAIYRFWFEKEVDILGMDSNGQ